MTYYLGGIVILTATGIVFALGYIVGAIFAVGAQSELPVKRTNEIMNREEALRHQLRKSDASRSLATYYLKQIVDGLDGQQSGAAVKAVRLAKQGLGE